MSVRLKSRPLQIPRAVTWTVNSRLADGTPWLRYAKLDAGYLARYPAADFLLGCRGDEVTCVKRKRATSLKTLRHLLLDQVLPIVLNLRGQGALHATGILTAQGVCAFTGPAGTGKSTLAASFLCAGYPSLGDDCLAITENGRFLATPAYPGVRLWTDAAVALAMDSAPSVPVADYSSKRRILGRDLVCDFPSEPEPLARIYRISRQAEDSEPAALSIERLSPREAFLELLGATFPLDASDQQMLTRSFRFIERLVAAVPVLRLRIPNDLSALPAVREAVLADLQND
ncbi:MAG: hypothetical protein ACREQN_19235 [Candidatus Binataceae bacterium]